MTRFNHWTGDPVRKTRRSSRLDGRYVRVNPTDEERAAYAASHPGSKGPAVYRLRCLTCEARIWGSGLGIGSHERSARHSR